MFTCADVYLRPLMFTSATWHGSTISRDRVQEGRQRKILYILLEYSEVFPILISLPGKMLCLSAKQI